MPAVGVLMPFMYSNHCLCMQVDNGPRDDRCMQWLYNASTDQTYTVRITTIKFLGTCSDPTLFIKREHKIAAVVCLTKQPIRSSFEHAIELQQVLESLHDTGLT